MHGTTCPRGYLHGTQGGHLQECVPGIVQRLFAVISAKFRAGRGGIHERGTFLEDVTVGVRQESVDYKSLLRRKPFKIEREASQLTLDC